MLILSTVPIFTVGKAISSDADGGALYAAASAHIESEEYREALAVLRQLQKQYPGYSGMAAVHTRIAVLQESFDAGDSLGVFLQALNLRDEGNINESLRLLSGIASADPAGTLTDDALYISAYLQVMDRFDFNAARKALSLLEERFPDSAYKDSALYLDAIALEQLGQTGLAKTALIELRERHTALNLPLKYRWPKGSVLSRYWFDRADRRLSIVEHRLNNASRMQHKEIKPSGNIEVSVSVNGADMDLILVPSPLTKTTQWLDGDLGEKLPPEIGVYDGKVKGIDDSWVRVVLQQDSITGVLSINGKQHRLEPDNLIGTLDYYKPKVQPKVKMYRDDSPLADNIQGLDALVAPPLAESTSFQSRSRSVITDVRAVPVSIVIDSQFDRYYAGGGLANALNNLNIADGVYRQFGLALALDEAIKFSEQQDPMNLGAVPLETILRSFRDYRLQYDTLFEGSALSYLFTGNPKTDVTLGLAWIDTACRIDGYDVGVITPSTFGDVLLTHELGHSLGALHDTDTSCNTNSLSLMWPNISERTQTAFSECSKASVLKSRAKSCLLNSIDLGLNAESSGTDVSFVIVNPDTGLTVDTQLAVETSSPSQLQWPAGCQAQSPTSAVCYVNALGPGSQRSISFPVSSEFQQSDSPVSAKVTPVNVMELNADNNVATVTLLAGSEMTQEPLPNTNGSQTSNQQNNLATLQTTNTPSAAVNTGGGWIDALTLFVMLSTFASRLGARSTRVVKRWARA